MSELANHVKNLNENFDLITEGEVANILRLKTATVAELRRKQKGPPHIKVGGSIRYRMCEVVAWIEEQRSEH